MSVIEPVMIKMREIIPNLPQNWAEQVGDKMGISKEVVRQYARGDRGRRNKKKAIEILRFMKEIEEEFRSEIAELTEK